MRRLLPFVAAVALAAGIAGGLPGRCAACSCALPASLAEAVRRSPDLAVFVGVVEATEGDPGTGGVARVRVEGRFRAPLLPPVIRARHGGGGDCTIWLTVGERRLFTARVDEQGIWFPALCDPQGVLGTAEGQALLAEATRTYGPLQPVGGPPVAVAPSPDPVVLVTVAGVVALLGIGLLGGVALLARRRRAAG